MLNQFSMNSKFESYLPPNLKFKIYSHPNHDQVPLLCTNTCLTIRYKSKPKLNQENTKLKKLFSHPIFSISHPIRNKTAQNLKIKRSNPQIIKTIGDKLMWFFSNFDDLVILNLWFSSFRFYFR